MLVRLPVFALVIAIGPTGTGFAQQPPAGTPAGGTTAPRPPIRKAIPERVRLVLAAQGNEARYRVREQLANFDFPSDAVGSTRGITGAILVGPDGKIVPDSSRFEIDLRTLASNESRRDRFLQRNTLKTDSFPQVIFVPTAVTDLSQAPVAVPASFQLAGNLTIRGVTRPAAWDVNVKQVTPGITGTAVTRIAFADFGLEVPRLALLLSVKDTITLEYDFHLVRDSSGTRTE
jgi:polyisoprenoid-binding protein YceI